LQALQTELAALQNPQGQPPELIRADAGTSFDQSSGVKRTKKTAEQIQQLKLDTQTVKELTSQDFALVNGGYECGIRTGTCRR